MSGLAHIGITVSDLDRAIDFFTDVLHCRLLERVEPGTDPLIRSLVGVADADIAGAFLETSAGEQVELVHYRAPVLEPVQARAAQPGAVHLAFHVPDIAAALLAVTLTGGGALGGTVELGGRPFVYCSGIDGVVFELIEDRP